MLDAGPEVRPAGRFALPAQVVVPEESSRDRSPRPPLLCQGQHLIGAGSSRQALDLGYGRRERHVGRRPHIRPQKSFHQVDRGRPRPDAGQGDERALRDVVGQRRQPVEIQLARRHGSSQVPHVCRLLAAEPDRQQLRVVESKEPIGRQFAGRRRQTSERRQGRGERDLLLEHEIGERGEPDRSIPQGRRSEPLDDATQVGVSRGQFVDGEGEGLLGKRRHRGGHA
jgi:hypothetical protein